MNVRWTSLWLMGASMGCASDVPPEPDAAAELYQQVESIITQGCARDVCHGYMVANARMDLIREGFRAALVNVPACEYDRMMRVKPFDPDHSWIMIKLAGPKRFRVYTDFVDFQPEPGWTPSIPECSSTFDDGSAWFGTPMPPPDTTEVTPQDIAVIRRWIAEGARGP